MDDVLELLSGTAPEYAGGYTNHAPMATEALCHLGLSHEAFKWAELYKKRHLEKHHKSEIRFTASEWKDYLGQKNYFDAWKNLFETELASNGWQSSLRRWLPRLLPGIVAAAMHGVLRTGHAVRSLEQSETKPRINELCSGLAYWAATYQTLPEAPNGNRQLRASQAIYELKMLPISERKKSDLISDGLQQLHGRIDFAKAIHLLNVSEKFDDCLSDIMATFVRAYLPNAESSLIAALHAVTGPGALQMLAGYVDEQTRVSALKYAWQASAALYVTFGTELPVKEVLGTTKTDHELVEDAIRSEDEHAIKFTEVCLRLTHKHNDPIFKIAAQDATKRLAKFQIM
jgi:hypothetical protein